MLYKETVMSKENLDTRGVSEARELARETHSAILTNPDLLSRTFRLFHAQHLRSETWDRLSPTYIEKNYPPGHAKRSGKRTNLRRQLWDGNGFTWDSLIEGLAVLKPLFDSIDIKIATDKEIVHIWTISINDFTLDLVKENVKVPDLPLGTKKSLIVPPDFERSASEPFLVAIMRNLISELGLTYTSASELINVNCAYLPPHKLQHKRSNIMQSVRRGSISWGGFISVLKSLGMVTLTLTIEGIKNGKISRTTQALRLQ